MTVFLAIMLFALVITFYRFYMARQYHNESELVALVEQSVLVNNRLTDMVETLTGIRDLAEYYLLFPAELPKQLPSLRQDGKYFYLNKARQNLAPQNRIMTGNITGVGQLAKFDTSLKQEVIMANTLTPAFVAAQESIKEANWLYYISMRGFVNLYPWVPRNIWQYNAQSLTNDLMLKIKSAVHHDTKFWSRPYADSTGKGLNAALGLGVYLNKKMLGAVIIDINTAGLYDHLPEITDKDHGYIIVDRHSHVLLHKRSDSFTLSSRTVFSDTAPEQLNQFDYQALLNTMPSSEIGDWIVQKQILPVNDWILLEYRKKSSFYAVINHRFLAIFTSIFFGLLLLLVVIYYVTHRTFIAPSKQFVSHIENCSAGDPGKIKPSAEWRHWFKIVEDLFGENRSLLQRLKDQNNDLDLRVKEKTQALLYKSEQHQRDYALLRSVMDSIPDYILFNDQQNRLIGCNQAMEQLLLQKEVDILGCEINDLIRTTLGDDVANSVYINHCDNDNAFQKTISTLDKTYDVYNAPFYAEGSTVLGNIILIRDVTQQYEINQALQKAKNQAEDANKIKSQFLANMSHEIRTPINAIQGMFFLLQQSALNKIQKQYLLNAQTASSSLLFLVDELLDSAKVESGHMTIHKKLTQLENIVAQAINLNISSLYGKNLQLNVVIDSNVPLQLNTDAMRLIQVLSNLLNNAIKFTESGQVSLSITLSKKSTIDNKTQDAELIVKVKDTGIGIAKAKQNSLFEAFKQADESMTRIYGGTGLGLSICQHIAQLLGGNISIDSDLGRGAEFTLVLPINLSLTYIRNSQECDNSLFTFRGQLSAYSLVNMLVDMPNSLRKNFIDIASEIIDINSLSELQSVSFDKPKILFLDGSNYPQGFNDKEFAVVCKNADVIALCQSTTSVVSHKLIEQMNFHSVQYLLLELPLYRNVIEKIVTEVHSLSNNTKQLSTGLKNENNFELLQGLLGVRVLLVEDNAVNQLIATKLLESLGVVVVIAENGQQALDVLSQETFDLVLMDVQMPIMDGLTATRLIRAQHKFKYLPIIAMTAHARKEDKRECLAAGMNLHLAKPITIEAVKEHIFSVLKS